MSGFIVGEKIKGCVGRFVQFPASWGSVHELVWKTVSHSVLQAPTFSLQYSIRGLLWSTVRKKMKIRIGKPVRDSVRVGIWAEPELSEVIWFPPSAVIPHLVWIPVRGSIRDMTMASVWWPLTYNIIEELKK